MALMSMSCALLFFLGFPKIQQYTTPGSKSSISSGIGTFIVSGEQRAKSPAMNERTATAKAGADS